MKVGSENGDGCFDSSHRSGKKKKKKNLGQLRHLYHLFNIITDRRTQPLRLMVL